MAERVLLVVGGGIAAYKCLDLIRRLRERGIAVRAVMTRAAGEFVTPLSVGALTNDRVFTDLFSLDDERDIGHIRLSREANLVVVAPATADLLAKMAGGHADDLASTLLLATDKPVLVAPAMNPRMWLHPATRRNMALLAADGVHVVGPNTGEMAEAGEAGPGRLAEVPELVERIEKLLEAVASRVGSDPQGSNPITSAVQDSPPPNLPRKGGGTASSDPRPNAPTSSEKSEFPRLSRDAVPPPLRGRLGGGEPETSHVGTPPFAQRGGKKQPLAGHHVLVTSGPTHEPIDPVRYIANRSSGKQGHAIAAAAARLGARVTLVSGPVALADPQGVDVEHVETAAEMLAAVRAALPADIAIFAAAVADWRAGAPRDQKIKKSRDGAASHLQLVENDDILKTIAAEGPLRPRLVIGFAAETEEVVAHAKAKLTSKGADWIVANDVTPAHGVMGGDRNRVHLVTADGVESWPELAKDEVASFLVERAAEQIRDCEAAE